MLFLKEELKILIINKVEICGVNTSKLPVLKEKEKRELLLKMREGDKTARETFIKGNLRLVLSVIQRFNNSCISANEFSNFSWLLIVSRFFLK